VCVCVCVCVCARARACSTFVDQYLIELRPLYRGQGDQHARGDHGDVTITVPAGASCRQLLALLATAVCREGGDGGGGAGGGGSEGGTRGCEGLGGDGILHKVVDHDVALGCPAVNCLWCRTLTSMDGRARGSLSRPARDAGGAGGSGAAVGEGFGALKSLTVSEMLRRQAKARRRLALPPESPYVLYYHVSTSIHAPSSGSLQVRWLQPPPGRVGPAGAEDEQKILEVPVRHDSRACDVLSKLRQMAPVRGSGQVVYIYIYTHTHIYIYIYIYIYIIHIT